MNTRTVILDDTSWTLVTQAEEAFEKDQAQIWPIGRWQEIQAQAAESEGISIWLDSDEEVEAILTSLSDISLMALHFPSYKDGRPYSTASILRQQGFSGPILAFGDVRSDQLEQMYRCGFSHFLLPDDTLLSSEDVDGFSDHYQSAADGSVPLFQSNPQD